MSKCNMLLCVDLFFKKAFICSFPVHLFCIRHLMKNMFLVPLGVYAIHKHFITQWGVHWLIHQHIKTILLLETFNKQIREGKLAQDSDQWLKGFCFDFLFAETCRCTILWTRGQMILHLHYVLWTWFWTSNC